MIDVKDLRENSEIYKENTKRKFRDSKIVDSVLKLDVEWRKIKSEADSVRSERNKISEQINQEKKKGRPKRFDGKVNVSDLSRFSFLGELENGVQIFEKVLHHVSLNRRVKAVCLKKGNTCKLFFSSDFELDGKQLIAFYRLRFQIEFLFRDAKQHLGLTHCQARDKQSLNFHFNANFSLLNILKAEHHLEKANEGASFSLTSIKRQYSNTLLLNLFISKSDLNLSLEKIKPIIEELRNFGVIVA